MLDAQGKKKHNSAKSLECAHKDANEELTMKCTAQEHAMLPSCMTYNDTLYTRWFTLIHNMVHIDAQLFTMFHVDVQ